MSGSIEAMGAEGTVSAPGLIAIMGSGELTTSMASTHRALVATLRRAGEVRPLFLDTPAAFQENVSQLGERAVSYFRETLRLDLTVAHWRDHADPEVRARFLARLAEANYVFAGPGSPSFALRSWSGTDVPSILRGCVRDGGCLVFASAAALTLGAFTVPVYEIFKVGEEPRWIPGLDLLSEAGLQVAVVPHYDNRTGTGFDTRFCYLGEARFLQMEDLLPPSVAVLGVDEHTACIVDVGQMSLAVRGRGAVTIGRGRRRLRLPTGERVPLADLSPWVGSEPRAPDRVSHQAPTGGAGPPPDLRVPNVRSEDDIAALVRLALGLVEGGEDSPSGGRAAADRLLLGRTILRLGDLAHAYEKTYESQVRPLVESLMEIRDRARQASDWVLADDIRDMLKRIGVEVRDKPSGSEWSAV